MACMSLYDVDDETIVDNIMGEAEDHSLPVTDDLGTTCIVPDRKCLIGAAAVVNHHNLVLQDSSNATQFIQQFTSIPCIFKQPLGG
jgi:hypothetical protein